METQVDPLFLLMQLSRSYVAERYPGVELAAYLDELEPLDGALKLTWACTSARRAFGNIVEMVWHKEMDQSTLVVHVADRDDPREVFVPRRKRRQ
jgi:hypothetical protein